MPRRRMISEELNHDPEFNTLSMPAERLFVRLLTISDDFGFVEATPIRLNTKLNLQCSNGEVENLLKEIDQKKLGKLFGHHGKVIFMFKPSSFDKWQSYLLAKRKRSEVLNLPDIEVKKIRDSWKD